MRSFNDPSMSIWARLMELIPGWSGRRALEGKWETRENAPTQTAGGSPDSDPFLSLFCEAWNDDRGCVVDRHRSPPGTAVLPRCSTAGATSWTASQIVLVRLRTSAATKGRSPRISREWALASTELPHHRVRVTAS